MPKEFTTPRNRLLTAGAGQAWRMAAAGLHVTPVEKLMLNYKLRKPGAARLHTSIGGINFIEKILKDHKAVPT